MSLRTIRRLSVVIAALLLFIVPAAHAQTPPNGDSRLSPVTVKLNASKTVKNAQFATLEAPAIEAVSCDGNASSDHSVWFRFELPAAASLDIDANGSLLDTGGGFTTQLVMTLYRQDLTVTEVDCLFMNKPRMVDVSLTSGTYLVRLASDFAGTLQGPSQYRISIRVRFMAQFLTDSNFDAVPLDPAWKIKNAGTPSQIAHECPSFCYVSFNGIVGGKLQQTVSLDTSLLKIKVGDYFGATFTVNGTPVAGSDIRLAVQLNYADGTPPTKASMVDHVVQTNTSNIVSIAGGLALEIRSKALKSIKFTIVSPSTDVFRVHSAALSLAAGSSVRAPLPVPPSP